MLSCDFNNADIANCAAHPSSNVASTFSFALPVRQASTNARIIMSSAWVFPSDASGGNGKFLHSDESGVDALRKSTPPRLSAALSAPFSPITSR